MENSARNIPALQTLREGIPETQTVTKDISTARSSTDDLSTARTLTEDIQEAQPLAEDIIIKCNLEEMTKSFFQDYVIVWHDPNVSSQENQQYIDQLKRFYDVFTFSEWQKAKDFLQVTPTACHVVTSGTNGELLVKEISSNQNVANIYIFCENKEYHSGWAKTYQKVSCIETRIEDVLSRIQQNLLAWYKQASSLKLNLPAFAPIFNDYDKSQMNNLHRFLKVIPNFQNRLQAKNDFVNISKVIYSDPKNTKLIADFEQNYNEYDKEQTLRWYSQESFLYKVTNNCLRIATSDSIQYCRLLLQDIQRAIKEQYQTKSKNFNGLLYRGAYLSQEEWQSLKANLNREIEMHGFLSVTKVKNIGLNFMKADPSKKALITIIIPKGPNEEEQGFAEMEEFSEYPQEKEILFNVRSRFTILETEDDGPYRHLVLMYGAQGFRKYMTEQNPTLEISIPSQKNILCSQCKVTNSEQIFFISLIDPQKQTFYCKECVNPDIASFLCIPPIKKEVFIARISGVLLMNSHHTELPFYGYKCSSEECQAKKQKQYFTCTDCDQKWCQSCFENSHNETHHIILETSPFSFWYQRMSQNELTHIKFQSDLITNNTPMFQQAEMYSESQLYEKAIEYYSIYIQQNEAKGKDSNLAHTYNNLGVAFQKQGEYTKALEYHFKSLDIFKSIFGDNYPGIVTVYSNIGHAYESQEEYSTALEYGLKSLEIAKSLSEDNRAELFTCYNNLGKASHHKGEYKKALEYYEKSLDIAKSVFGDSHPEVATSFQNIGSVYEDQREYNKALEYHFKSLDIYKLVYGENHPEIALSLNNIALVFLHQAEYNKALEYYFKSLDINKSVYRDNHPEIALCFDNIGMLYEHQGEYKKALEYYFKALDIYKAVYGDRYFDTATSYQSIGQVYSKQGEYKKALEYYFKALDINKSIREENHPEIASSFNSIGMIYDAQGEYAKALEYYLKALDIFKVVYGENHPMTASSLSNIGLAFYHQAEYNKALEYHFKSLDINKAVYGDSHLEVATSYENIGLVYGQQGEYKKALEYFLKCLEIQKALYGDNHSQTLSTQKRILMLQSIVS